MDETTKDRNKSSNPTNIKDFSDKTQFDMSLSGDNIMSMASAHLYSTIAQAEFKETSEDPTEDGDKKKIREKTRKDKIRQGIHKLSQFLPDNYHTKEGQKETLVSILEKAAEYMSSMTKSGDDDPGEGSSDKLNTDVLKEFKEGLDSLKSDDKDLGSEMEAALSVMAGSMGEDPLEPTTLKLGRNNNTMDMISNENQDTSIRMGSNQNNMVNNKQLMQNNQSMNMHGLGDSSFMSGIGSSMFGDGPLLPSLMSPMLPGSAMGGMLGSFPSMNSNLMQSNNNMGSNNSLNGVNTSNNNTQSSNLSNSQSFGGFNQDNLFLSPSSVNTGTPGGNSTVSNHSTSLLDNNLQSTNMNNGEPQQVPVNNIKLETTQVTKSETPDSNMLQMPFINNATSQTSNNLGLSMLSQGNSDSKSASSMGLFSQASNVQNVVNTSMMNSSIVLPSANMNTNMTTIAPQLNVGNNFVSIPVSSMGSFNFGLQQQPNVQTMGNMTGNGNLVTVSSSNNTSLITAQQKAVTNFINPNMPMIGQQQVGTIQQPAINQNIMMPQMQGTTVGPLQGTLVLHNNQLILVPNNQQQMMNTGLAINQNLQGNIINQGATLPNQVIGGSLQNMSATGVQNVVNTGIQNATHIQGSAIGGSIQNVIGVSQAQSLQKQGSGNIMGTTHRIGFNQQQIVGNTGMIHQTNQGTVLQTGLQPTALPAVPQAAPAGTAQGSAATVNINTPGGVVQMNTAPSAPNQLPSALILPNGQIVPVVTQPSVVNQQQPQQQTILQQPGSMVFQGNQIATNQGGQLTIQTPASGFGSNQIIGTLGGGTGLLMTTAMTQGVKSGTITTMANTGLKTFHTQTNQIQHLNTGGTGFYSNIMKGPILVPSKSNTLSQQQKTTISRTSSSGSTRTSTSSKSSKSSSKSSKKLVTNLPTTVQAMLTPEGNIILSLPPGANPGSVLGKPLTPVTSCANAGKLPISKKGGQRIIMPKPMSGAPVATIAPLLPGQSTNIMATSSISTPTIVSTVGLPKGGGGHITPNQMNLNTINANSMNSLSVAVAGSLPSMTNMDVPTPPVCSQAANRPLTMAPVSTDILAKAAESIFQVSGMSPGFYNNTNDDNPLQIDDTTSTSTANNMQHPNNQIMRLQSTDISLANPNTPLFTQVKPHPQTSSVNSTGAKPKVTKPKDPSKVTKPKKKCNKENKSSKKVNNKNSVTQSQFTSLGSPSFTSNSDMASNFSMGTDQFIPDLADNFDDGDDESDINDFQDLIRLHAPKTKSIPSIALEENNLPQMLIPVTTSSDTLPSLPNILNTSMAEETIKSASAVPKDLVTSNVINSSQQLLSAAITSSAISDSSPVTNVLDTNVPKLSSVDLVSSWINTTVPDLQPHVSSSASTIQSLEQTSVTSPEHIAVSALVSPHESGVSEPKYTLSPSMVSLNTSTAVTSLSDGVIASETIQCTSSTDSSLLQSPPTPSVTSNVCTNVSSNSNDLMGLTPMEIIQSIAESSGNEKIEKNPKENKEPSPRISQKKLAKAGKGPPPSLSNSYMSRSPKRSDQSRSPKSGEQAKSPKRRELSKSPKRSSGKSDTTEIVAAPEKKEEIVKEDSSTVLEENKLIQDPVVNNAIKISPKKESKKSTPKKSSPKKETDKILLTSSNKSPKRAIFANEENLSNSNLVTLDSQKAKTPDTVRKKRTKSKERNKTEKEKQRVQEKAKKVVIEDYPDDPPTLEREEPFPELASSKVNEIQTKQRKCLEKDLHAKMEKKKDENIFMNAIISEKSDYFGTGPSLFSQSGMSGIPPFTNASLPPPPFGFGNPYFRFPMINTSAGIAGFQPHLQMFAQAPPLFSNSFGEVPFKFPENHMATSPRGGFGNSDMGNKSPRSSFLETQKDKLSQKEVDTQKGKDSSDFNDNRGSMSSASGKPKKKSKKEKRKDKHSKSVVDEMKDIAFDSNNYKLEKGASIEELKDSYATTFPMSETSASKLSVCSSPRLPATYSAASEATSVIDIMPSSQIAPSIGSSIYPEATSEMSEKSGKRKKVKKKKKERRKRDKSESEYEFEIVQHTVITEDSSVPASKTKASEEVIKEISPPPNVAIPTSETEAGNDKGRKSRSRSKKRGVKAEQVNNSADLVQTTNNSQEDSTSIQETVFDSEQNFPLQTSAKDRKSYSLRGRGMSPKGAMEEPPGDIFEDEQKKQMDEVNIEVSEDFFPMAKISPLKQSPTKPEIKEVPKGRGKNKSSSRGGGNRSRSRKAKDQALSEHMTINCDTKENNELNFVPPELPLNEQPSKAIKLKISNKVNNDNLNEEESNEKPEFDGEEFSKQVASPSAGKILKTNRAQRKSDCSPPKITKFGGVEVATGRKSRRPSPLKTLSKGSKTPKGTAMLTATTKTGPLDVFDFDDEPDDQLPMTLKSYASKTKEQSSMKYQSSPDVSRVSDFEQQNSPSKQPSLKLKLGKGKDKKSKTENIMELDHTMSSEFADSEMSFSVVDAEVKGKKGKKSKSRKRSKKGKAQQNDTEADDSTTTNRTVSTTESELNQSQESVFDMTPKVYAGKSKKGKKIQPQDTIPEPAETFEGLLSSPDHMVIDIQQNTLSTSENEDKSDKESNNVQKEHVGLEKTIKALHQRLNSTSPIRLPAVLPGYEDKNPVSAKDKKVKTKSKKRGRDSSQSESEALDLTVQDHRTDQMYGPVPDGKTDVASSEVFDTETEKTHTGITEIAADKFLDDKSSQNKTFDSTQLTVSKTSDPLQMSQLSQGAIDKEGLFQPSTLVNLKTGMNERLFNSVEKAKETLFNPPIGGKSKTERKGSKSRKRSKDDAKLDHQPNTVEMESGSKSDPTPAKVQKVIDQQVFPGTGKATELYPAEQMDNPISQPHLQDPKKTHEKEKKARKRPHSSKSKNKNECTPGVILEGSIPETITFSENDLFAVLDQVEGSSKLEDNSKSEPTDEVPLKKAKDDNKMLEVKSNDSIEDTGKADSMLTETVNATTNENYVKSHLTYTEQTVPLYAKDLVKDMPCQRTEQNLGDNKLGGSSDLNENTQGDSTSPSKKEKKKDRKKRRKERHAVREMSENDLSRSEPFVIPDLRAPVPEKIPEKENIPEVIQQVDNIGDNIMHSDTSSAEASVSGLLTTQCMSTSSSASTTMSVPSTSMISKTSVSVTSASSATSAAELTATATVDGVNSENSKPFKIPHPVSSSEASSSITARGNPSRPLERTSSTSHLVARIPKKRIDAYLEYENATIQQPIKSSTNTEAIAETKQSDSNTDLIKTTDNSDKSIFDTFGPSPMNPYGTDFSYDFSKPVVPSSYTCNPPSSSTNLNFINMDDNTVSTVEEKKDSEDASKSNSTSSSKFMDFDYIPPSPLSSARHSHLGSLAQVAQLRATSIVMPASPRTPLSGINSRSNKKDKEKQELNKNTSKDNSLSKDNQTEKDSSSNVKSSSIPTTEPIMQQNSMNTQMENSNKSSITSVNDNSNIPESISLNNTTNNDILSQQMPPPQMPPPDMSSGEKSIDKDVDKMNEQLEDPYSPDVNYTSEPLFSPPSILPPDSVNQEHDHSPTMPAVQNDNTQPKPKEAAPAPPAPNPVYQGNNYMDTSQGMDLSQRGMYNQDANPGSSTCALQQVKQQQGMYDNFSPPYASQASSGPSPSMGSSNPGSNQMLSPNMNSSVVNTATTTSYTSSTSSSQMAGQRGYSSYYPMPSGTQQSVGPGPPPPLMQPSYGIDNTTTQRGDSTRSQNRTPGMVNSDRMASPHPSNQPKNYSSYMSTTDSHTSGSQHSQQREPQRLSHPEKESRSQRSSGVHGGQMPSAQSVGSSQRNRSSSASGRSSSMSSDNRGSSHSNQYYPQTSYSGHSGSQLTSPPLHHRGPAPTDQQQNSSSQRSSYDNPYSVASAYGALASYSSYNNTQSLTGNSSSSHSQSVPQQQKSSTHSQRSTPAAPAPPKNMPSKQPPAAHSGSHHRQPQHQQPSMQQAQQPVKSSSNRSSGSSSKSSSSKKTPSASKSAYSDMDQAMMNSMLDPRTMTPYFFNSLHSPSSRNFHTEANPYFSGMFSNHQRQSSQHKSSDMNNPFMFPHSRSQNGIGFNWTGMNPAHNNHHTSTAQSSHSNSSASHLSGFNFNLFGAPEMNSSHTQDISPMKLPHSQLLSQHGMDHNAAALQHQSFYQNRGQMPSSMLHNPMSFLGHQHPGFDGRSMGAGTMGAHFGGHGAGFGMPFLPD